MMEGSDQEAGGDADRFRHVVVLHTLPCGINAVALREDGYEDGGDFKEWLAGVGAEWGEGIEPFGRGAAGIEFLLLALSLEADSALDGGIGDHGEVPGLLVGARWRGPGGEQRVFNHRARHGAIRKVTH